MLSTTQIEDIGEFFAQQEHIRFVILFGSQVKERTIPLSDVDLALDTESPLSLLSRGRLIAELEMIIKTDVDLLDLNRIVSDNPRLAHEIFSTGKVIHMKDREAYLQRKEEMLRRYLDTQPLRAMVDNRFRETG